MKLRHILVQHEYEAKDLERKLQQGESFELLAKKFSTCSSASSGGDLGEFSTPSRKNRLDPDFLDAAEALQVGKVSRPIRTRFGYHLILKYA